MRILMLTTNSSLMDGINRHILTISTALNSKENFEVAVCTVNPKGELNEALEKQGIKTYSLNAANGHDWHILKTYYHVIKTYKPDIVHTHVMAIMERIISSLFFRKIKYVLTIHGIGDKVKHVSFRMRFESMLQRLFPIPYTATCFISNGVKQMLSIPSTYSEVIYNALPFKSLPSPEFQLHHLLNLPLSTPIIGTSCRIANVKNPVAFTKVMCKVLTNITEAHAVIIGDGNKILKEKCNEIIRQHKVEDRFHWLGYRQDAPQLVQDLNCFVMTSICEGLPTSLLECMVIKTPIAFLEGEGGLQDLAQYNKTEGPIGVTAAPGNIEEFADKITKLIQDPTTARQYAERAYVVGKKYFDIESVVDKLAGLYIKVVG